MMRKALLAALVVSALCPALARADLVELASWPVPEPMHGYGAVAVDPRGFVYATASNQRVYKFLPDGMLVTSWDAHDPHPSSGYSYISDIAVDSAGNVLVVDYLARVLRRFTGDGTPLEPWPIANLGAVAADQSGAIFVSTFGGITRLDLQGNQTGRWPSEGALDLAVDNNGSVYARSGGADLRNCSPPKLFHLDPNGLRQIPIRAGQGGDVGCNVGGMGVDATGGIWMTDSADAKFVRFNRDGRLLLRCMGTTPQDSFGLSYDAAAAPWGDLYLVGLNVIRRLRDTRQPGPHCLEPPPLRLSRFRVVLPRRQADGVRLYLTSSHAGSVSMQVWQRLRNGKLSFRWYRGGVVHPGRNLVTPGRRSELKRGARYVIKLQLISNGFTTSEREVAFSVPRR